MRGLQAQRMTQTLRGQLQRLLSNKILLLLRLLLLRLRCAAATLPVVLPFTPWRGIKHCLKLFTEVLL